jgi:hypothetical protein
MSLKLLGMIHVATQEPLHNIGLGVVVGHIFTPKDLFIIIIVR